jgi:hypothetical protein
MPLKNDWANGDLFTPAAANDMANVVNAFGPPTATGQSVVTAANAAEARTAIGAASPSTARRVIGSKIRGSNITTKPGYNWNHLWSEWDWDNWIRPQVDRAVALGLNTVRFIALPRVVFDTTESLAHPSWATSTAYTLDRVRKNGSRLYRVSTAGTSASSGGGPTGTGSSITDGTIVWSYVRLANLAPLTQQQYDSRWSQFVEYCAQKSLMVYPSLCTIEDFNVVTGSNGDFQNASLTASIVTTAQNLSKYDNVLGFDLFQEGGDSGYDWRPSTVYQAGFPVNLNGRRYVTAAGGTSASSGGPTGTGASITDGTVTWAYDRETLVADDVIALMTAIRSVSNVPLTCSSWGQASGNFMWRYDETDLRSLWYNIHSDPAGSDFVDTHLYAADVTAEVVSRYAKTFNKPLLIGEYGIDATSGDFLALTKTQYANIARIHNMAGCVGSLSWALAQLGSTDPNYIWDNTGFVQANELGNGSPLSTTSGKNAAVNSDEFKSFALSNTFRQTIIDPEITNLQTTSSVFIEPTVKNPNITDSSGNTAVLLSPLSATTSAVNHVHLRNSATGLEPIIQAAGTDTDISISVRSKNSGAVGILTGTGFVHSFRNGGTNYLYSDGASTGNAPTISAVGTDSNINLALAPKGATGKVTIAGDEVPTVSSTSTITNKNLTSGTNTFPTFNQNTTGTAANITGTAAIANGGTGQTTAAAAITALTGTQTSGRYLRSDGTNSALALIVAADVPTLNQNTTGTASNVTGTVAVENGGTGATTLTGLVKGTGTTAMVAATAGTDYVAPGGALGTPSSATLTNATGLPVSGITASTSAALGVGSVELGHATDTSISRSSAGKVAVEGNELADAIDLGDRLTTGDPIMNRRFATNQLGATNGFLRLSYLTATKSETVTSVRVPCATAGVGATLARIGVYSIDGSGNLTLIASTPNDTGLWIASSTSYTKSLSDSFSKVRGTRYAIGIISVGASTAPLLYGNNAVAGVEMSQPPRLSAILTSQTDLPSTISVGSLGDTTVTMYSVLLP